MSPAEQTYIERLERQLRESREYAELLYARGRRWRIGCIASTLVLAALVVAVMAGHEMMGYRRVPHNPKHYQTPHGYAWKSPTGTLYEGHMGMVPDYLAKLTEAAKIINAIAAALESNTPLSGTSPLEGKVGKEKV